MFQVKSQAKSHLRTCPESHLEEVIFLRERVKSLESLDEYHRGQLVQKDLLMQELMGTVNRLATALPEGKRPAESGRGWWRWPWRRNGSKRFSVWLVTSLPGRCGPCSGRTWPGAAPAGGRRRRIL